MDIENQVHRAAFYLSDTDHSNSPKVRNILFHQMVSDYLDAAK
jgi:hypothetical protein